MKLKKLISVMLIGACVCSMAGLPFWGMDQGGFCVENRYVAAQKFPVIFFLRLHSFPHVLLQVV